MSKARKKRAQAAVAVASKPPVFERVENFVARRATVLALALILLGTIRIVATYTVFNHTSDEPAHLACGIQWLDQGIYQYEAQHPPLTRVMVALGPYLDGARSEHKSEMTVEGNAILYAGDRYERRLALSRAGNLPVFWLACWMVFLWGRRMLGALGAVVALLIFTMIPTVLAHAGLSTTDMGVTACFAAASYALMRLVEEPGPKTAAWLGLAGGLMVLTKFSALAFFPAAVAVALALWLYQTRPPVREFWRLLVGRMPWLGLAALLGFVVIWAGYRFSFGKTVWIPFPVPFPELFSGIQQVIVHNERGHLAYFMGEVRTDGWWTFFPTLIAIKIPLAILALIAIGLWRRPERGPRTWSLGPPVAVPLAILAVATQARINIGIRHILPMFPFLAIIAAAGALWLARQGNHARWVGWSLAAALVWLCATSLAAHPDYLPYFNALAGSEPERIVVDSDLDWGQDVKRLGARLRELNVHSVAYSPTIMIDPLRHGFPPYRYSATEAPFPGWNAVQITGWKLQRMGLMMRAPNARVWPDFIKPVERVGSSILLYYIPAHPQKL